MDRTSPVIVAILAAIASADSTADQVAEVIKTGSHISFIAERPDLVQFKMLQLRLKTEGVWVDVLDALQHEDGYEMLLLASPFAGTVVLFVRHGLMTEIEGDISVMWDVDHNFRPCATIKSTYGRSDHYGLEAWIYERQTD